MPEIGRQFVGREREIDVIGGALNDALAARGSLVLLVGEAGVGKTRLADEIAGRAAARGVAPGWGRCWDASGAPEYWPWIQILRPLVADLEAANVETTAPERMRQLGRLLPDLPGESTAKRGSPPEPPEVEQFRLFDAVASVLKEIASSRPLLLILDDLHAADPSSLSLMRFVARELRGGRILLLGTFREDESRRNSERAQLLGELAREGKTIAVTALGRSDVERLVEGELGTAPAADVVDSIYRWSEGIPLFVDEALRFLPSLPASAPPARLSGVVRNRLDRVSSACHRLLGAASVIGREFDLVDLRQLTELEAEPALELLGEATEAGLVRRQVTGASPFAFSHALLREVLYAELPPAARSRLHGKLALGLEQRHGREPRIAELAHHFFEAARLGAEPQKAAEYKGRAGDRARSQLAFEEAAAHYEHALQALDLCVPFDPGARCELLLRLGQVRVQTGDFEHARSAFLEAAERARRASDPERFGRAAIGFAGRNDVATQTDHRAINLLEEALDRFGGSQTTLRVRLLGRLAIALYYTPSRHRMDALSEEALELARRIGDPATLGFALHARHFAIWGSGPLDEKRRLTDEILERAHAAGAKEQEIGGIFWRFVGSLEAGNAEAAATALESYDRLAAELRQPFYLWRGRTQRSTIAILEGRFEEAEKLVREAVETGQSMTSPSPGMVADVQISWLRREQGRFEELEAPLRALAEMHGAMPAFRAGFAHLLLELGREAEARIELESLARSDFRDLSRDSSWLSCLQSLAEVSARLGNARIAAILYDLLAPYESQVIVAGFGEICQGSVAHYLGLLAHALGRRIDALGHFERAHHTHESLGARPFLARTRYEIARLLLGGTPSDRGRGEDLLAEAERLAGEIGMKALSARITALRRSVSAAEKSPANLFRLEGTFWTVVYDDAFARVKDSKGMRYVIQLVTNPGVEFPALELAGGSGNAAANRAGARELRKSGFEESDGGDAGQSIGRRATAAHRRRLEDLRMELEEAERFNDVGRAERARDGLDALTHELVAAIALEEHDRKATPDVERARVAITKTIREVLARLGTEHPSLARHLRESLRTGRSFRYAPASPTSWLVER